MISIINYGLGNLGSITNMLRYVGVPATIINSPEQLAGATKILLPGVGAFDAGMETLNAGGWVGPLTQKVVVEKIPVLGICLGMQLMTDGSEEGGLPGLGWIKGSAKRFRPSAGEVLKVPHMGWSDTEVRKPSALFEDATEEQRFYFVHSFYVALQNGEDELLRTNYILPFTSGFQRKNITGVQFHPEKSHKFGMQFLRNFGAL